MSLAREYKRQFEWRAWPTVFDALPPLTGQTVVDLGCAVGDQAAALAARGARVIGLDVNEELLEEARSRGIAGAEFRSADLREPLDLGLEADGLWSSFVAAYFPDLPAALARWRRCLRPGGWVALTEIDDLFGHEPLSRATRALFEGFAREALATKRYDFHMGRKLRAHLERAGLTVSRVLTLEDRELSFQGPAPPDVMAAWRARFERMRGLQDFCGPRFAEVTEEFLDCLSHGDHSCAAQVVCCLATR